MTSRYARTLGAVLAAATALACGGATPTTRTANEEPLPEPGSPPLPWEAGRARQLAVDSPLVAIVGGTVMTATGDILEDGVVVMQDGVLRAVGSRADVPVPEGAEIIDASGRFVTPGIIDTHSHMGVYAAPYVGATSDGNEATAPITAEVWAGDSFWPQDPQLPRALAGGITSFLVLPGSANLIGGRGATMKMHLGRSLSEMLMPGAPDTLKMACGENPKRVYGRRRTAPSTRMGSVAGYRRAYQQAREYGASWGDWQHNHRIWQTKRARYERNVERRASYLERRAEGTLAAGEDEVEEPTDPGPEPSHPTRNHQLDTLWGVLEGRVLVQMHCYRADEMVRMIELADEYGFRVRSFHHAVEAYKIRDILAANQVGISTWADWWGFKLEAYDSVQQNLALLSESSVTAVLHSDSAQMIQRLNQEAAKAMWAGRHHGVEVSDDQALRWITANAAWVLGIEERTGTLEVGKMADVVVWSGHPFSVYTRADRVYVDGLLRFDRSVQTQGGTTDFEVHNGGEAR